MIQVKIDNFEGPMDLLLHLIEKKQMKIIEINISQIIDDYLEYINKHKEENLKIKIEFLIMATDLIEIKAYSILNQEKKLERMEDLEKRIIEYKIFKEISELFSEHEKEYNIPYKKSGSQNIQEVSFEYDMSMLTLDNLLNNFKNLIKSEDRKPKMVLNLEEEYSSEEAFSEIQEIMENEAEIEFNSLLKNKFTKSRIVVLFLCVLELFKSGEIDIIPMENNFYIKKIN
ncbi:ScpA/B protein [Leptotrichia sp. oral taxon 215 str. W9775]|uniref:segregation and condensation protein A n=1 Tax=Leptotrichia sp. oral taxon 215 TaxID=712359 RepID=UPI0003ADE2A3|nr:segregation/condensation protein A [Leptotrichia sp. oral taxon 215]ERK65922.1 ScpA/B protein [Leptotrichia sp. oral taxon 215 str. W9775]